MDILTRYRDIVQQVILEYARYKPSRGEIKTEVIMDPKNDHYELIHVGWDDYRRIHGAVIHILSVRSFFSAKARLMLLCPSKRQG